MWFAWSIFFCHFFGDYLIQACWFSSLAMYPWWVLAVIGFWASICSTSIWKYFFRIAQHLCNSSSSSMLFLSVHISLSAGKQEWLLYFYSEDRDSRIKENWQQHNCGRRNGGRWNRYWKIWEAFFSLQATPLGLACLWQLNSFWKSNLWVPKSSGMMIVSILVPLPSIITRFPNLLHPSSPLACI